MDHDGVKVLQSLSCKLNLDVRLDDGEQDSQEALGAALPYILVQINWTLGLQRHSTSEVFVTCITPAATGS